MRSKFLHNLFFGFIAYIGACTMMIAVMPDIAPELPPVPTLLVGFCILLSAVGKLITHSHRHILRGGHRFLWQKRYSRSTLLTFCVLVVLMLLYIHIVDVDLMFSSKVPEGVTSEEFAQPREETLVNLLVLILGCMYLWILHFNMLYTGLDRIFPKAVLGYARQYICVYLLYRLAMFLLTLAASLFMGMFRSGGQNSYFLFVMDDPSVQGVATGSITGSGFFGGVTAASSFYILSTMAEEYLSGSGEQSRTKRLSRMFLELDTAKLLMMSVLGMAVSMLSLGKDSLLESVVNGVLIIFWLMSMLLFLADTQIVDFLVNFAVMGFVERLIPMPEMTGFLGLLLAVLATVVRMGLFALVALLIGNFQIYRRRQEATAQNSIRGLLWLRITHVTFLDMLRWISRMSELGLKALNIKEKSTEEEDLVLLVHWCRKADDFLDKRLAPLRDKADELIK